MNYLRILITAVILAIIAQIIHTIEAMLTMKYYMMEQLFPVWSKVMMPQAGPPPPSFMYLSLAFGVLTAIIFVVLFITLKNAVPGKGWLGKGLAWGLITFLLADLSGMLMLYLLINLPKRLILAWAISGLVIKLISGPVTAAINK